MKYIYAKLFMHSEYKRKRRIPFSFPLQLCIVLNDEMIKGLDGESDSLAWKVDHVFWVFEMRYKESCEESLVWYAYVMKWSVCKRTLRSSRDRSWAS